MLARIFASTSRKAPAITICRRHASASIRPNAALIEMLKAEVRAEKEKPNPNRYRHRSLVNAIDSISKLDHDIISLSNVKNIDGIGRGILNRIQNYLEVRHQQTQGPQKDKDSLIMELASVTGIGKSRAEKLVKAGCNGLAGLQDETFFDMLTPTQRVLIRYGDHLRRPVPCDLTETVAEFIRSSLSPKHEVVVVGSCRRNADSTTAVDVMLFHPEHVHVPVPPPPPRGALVPVYKQPSPSAKARAETPLYKFIVPTLQERGLIVAPMRGSLRTWSGLIRVPEKDEEGRWRTRRERLEAVEANEGDYRRLNLSMMPLKSRGAALIHHTGDSDMKKQLKRKADQLGFYFDELGLWKWHADNAEDAVSVVADDDTPSSGFWQLLQSTTEEAIFEQLGMDYVEPERRNLENLR
ncbi:hypothetical protein D9615_002724 [Tricholomella constricta]|uniref:DNA polymerase n=1 Tax=Tricholomella constricta TaxID=117010 RepID=A0A8H5HGC1_9AGAR|nr:hypothetical protein D9615_002724 [Tricholomella constricta]